MCLWVGSHAPSSGRQLLGAAQPYGVSLTAGVIAPASLRYDRPSPVSRVAGPSWLAGNPLLGCSRARPLPVFAMALRDFSPVPDAAPLGSDQWPWSTAPATGPAGRLGCPSAWAPWGLVCCAPSLCYRRCVRACGVRGLLALVHRCARPVRSICGVCGQSALVHRCARSVRHARDVGGFVGVPSLMVFFPCCLHDAFFFLFLLFFSKGKTAKGRANTTGTGMGSWSSGAAVLCSSSRCVLLVSSRRWCPKGAARVSKMYTGAS